MEKYTLKRITIEEIPEPSMRLFDPEVDAVAIKAIEAVRSGGEVALRRWAQEFDGLAKGAPLVIAREEMKAAYDSLPEETAALLGRAKGRVAAFAAAQRACLAPLDVPALGGRHGHEFVPVARAGCYVPGGAFPLPSSALMTVIPAKAAGVPEVWCAGPKPTRETLAAAWLAGADGFLQCGGAHAIAALAFGIAVPRCDVIIGPGGKYVAAAKRLLYGIVGTEAPAGPSELLVIADESADPDIVAADLLAQAEHSPDAMPALIATHSHIADQIDRILRAQLAALPEPNRSIAQRSLQNGFCCIEPDPARIADGANHCAPEHLEIATSEPRQRFGYAYAPMDEALARAVIDISGRSYCVLSGTFTSPSIGALSTSNIAHFFQSFAANANLTLHLDILRGENDHHKAEALFKAAALALKSALEPRAQAPSASTKGETTFSTPEEGK